MFKRNNGRQNVGMVIVGWTKTGLHEEPILGFWKKKISEWDSTKTFLWKGESEYLTDAGLKKIYHRVLLYRTVTNNEEFRIFYEIDI